MLEREVTYRLLDSLSGIPVAPAQAATREKRPHRKMAAAVLTDQVKVYRCALEAQGNAADAKRRRFGIPATQILKEEEQRVVARQKVDGPHEGLVELAAGLVAMPEDKHDYSQMPKAGVVDISAAADGSRGKYLSCEETQSTLVA